MYQVYNDFLSNKECDDILSIDHKFNHATLSNDRIIDTKIRNSYTKKLIGFDYINDRIRETINYPIPYTPESLTIQKYTEGGFYLPHYDRMNRRIATFIIYLNDDFEGGMTFFPSMRIRIKPQKGKGFFFDYKDSDTLHAGQTVTKGNKFIITSWLEQKISV
jgi:prolyl 4-hydroxylase